MHYIYKCHKYLNIILILFFLNDIQKTYNVSINKFIFKKNNKKIYMFDYTIDKKKKLMY